MCLDFLASNAILYSDEKIKQTFCTDLPFEEMKIWTHLRKSRRTEIVEGFQLRTYNLVYVCSDKIQKHFLLNLKRKWVGKGILPG